MPASLRFARSRIHMPSSGYVRRAFTLIELLTVIAIIGILAAIIIPTVGRVRETAKASQCSSGMRQIAMGLFLYVEDNKGSLPPAKGVPPGGTTEVQWTKWIDAYLPKQGTSETAREHPLSCASPPPIRHSPMTSSPAVTPPAPS